MATKTDRRCVLEWPSCDWRLLKVATSTNKGSFGNVKKTSSMTSPRAMALDATRWRPLVAEFRRVKGAQDDLCFGQWARWCSLITDVIWINLHGLSTNLEQ